MHRYTLLTLLLVSILLATALAACGSEPPRQRITVSAAADLARALPEVAQAFTRKTGIQVDLNFGSTRKLATQIEHGAGVDFFAAADRATVVNLNKRGLVVPGTMQTYAIGRLVLCVPPGSKVAPKQVADLAQPGIERIAIANPDHAPYGRAAREAMQSAGIWPKVQAKVVPGENVQQALQYAETGNVDAALVALSLVQSSKVRWVLVPEKLHKPLEQTMCVLKGSKQEAAARQFASFLAGHEGRVLLKRFGFQLPAGKPK